MLHFGRLPIGVVVLSEAGKIIQANKKARDYYGMNKNAAEDYSATDFFPDDDSLKEYYGIIKQDATGQVVVMVNDTALVLHIGYLIKGEEKSVILLMIEAEHLEKIREAVKHPNKISELFPDLILNIKALLDQIYGYSQLLKIKLKEPETYKIVDDLDLVLKQAVALLGKVYKLILENEEKSKSKTEV